MTSKLLFNFSFFLALSFAFNSRTYSQINPSFQGVIPEKKTAVSPALANSQNGTATATNGFQVLSGQPETATSPAGTGQVISYENAASGWVQKQIIKPTSPVSGSGFGSAVSIDGNIAVVGAPNETGSFANQGAAYIFRYSGGTWTQMARLRDGNGKANHQFGKTVLVSGKYIFIAATGKDTLGIGIGAVYVYELLNNTTWTYRTTLVPGNKWTGMNFGTAMCFRDNELFVGAPNYRYSAWTNLGMVNVFSVSSNTWTEKQAIFPTALLVNSMNFGSSLAVFGNNLYVGAPGANYIYSASGLVFNFLKNSSGYSTTQIIPPNDAIASGRFGGRLSASGEYLGIQSNLSNTNNRGQVSVYKQTSSGLAFQLKLIPADGASGDQFGQGLGFAGNTLVAGSPFHDQPQSNSGAAYIYSFKGFNASDTLSDGYSQIDWYLPASCAHRPNNPEVYVQLWDISANKEIYKTSIDSINKFDVLQGSFNYPMRPASSASISFNLFEVGPGTPLCGNISDTARTVVFRKVNAVKQAISADRIAFSLSTSTYHGNKIRVFRNNKLIALLDKNATSFEDIVNKNDVNAIKNGITYSYCFQNLNSQYQDSSVRTCLSSSTAPIGFTATDNTLNDRVRLTWNNLAAYADYVEIERDAVRIAAVTTDKTSYEDFTCIPGAAHNYTLILRKNSNPVTSVDDAGSVPANGRISGRILNAEGAYGTGWVKVTATAVIDKKTYTFTGTTDRTGYYNIPLIYYGSSAEFTVTASRGSIAFTAASKKVTLSLANPDTVLDFESAIPSSDVQTSPFTVTNFTVTKKKALDELELSWNYTRSDTLWFKILRNKKLQTILWANSGSLLTYTDTSGLPGEVYEYSLEAYTLKDKKYHYFKVSKKDTFPAIAAPLSVIATSNPSLATVDLSWTHSSSHNSGFVIYRGSKKIGETTATTFTDLTGLNGQNYKYSVRAFTVKEDRNRYESPDRLSDVVNYPLLTAPDSALAFSNGRRLPQIRWKYSWNKNYNFTGVKIIRTAGASRDTVATVLKGFPSVYTDYTAKPNVNYNYRIITYKQDAYTTTPFFAMDTVLTDSIGRVMYASASDNYEGFIYLYWDYQNEGEHDGFLITRGTDSMWTVAFENTLIYPLGTNYNTNPVTFTIRAFRIINGIKYFSNPTVFSGKSTNKSGTTRAVSNLKGSTDLPTAVRLSWDYPDYIKPWFIIMKNGWVIDSVPFGQRVYFDYNVGNSYGSDMAYQVYASYNGNRSPVATCIGRTAPLTKIDGLVSNKYSRIGILNAAVRLEVVYSEQAEPFVVEARNTTTDSAGYFSFDKFYIDQNATYRLIAWKPNYLFAPDTIRISLTNAKPRATVNFFDTVRRTETPGKRISNPVFFRAKPVVSDQAVILTWTVDGPNYTRFKVYRGLVEIATVKPGEPNVFVDKTGVPGVGYAYRIQTEWSTDPVTTLNSEFVYTYAIFPILNPVENLRANPSGDAVKVTWTHISDIHTYYEIRRNDQIITNVATGGLLQYIDTTARPGTGYVYTVTSVLVNTEGVFKSLPVSVGGSFASVTPATALSLSQLANTVRISWQKGSPNSAFFNVYRDGVLIGSVNRNSSGNYFFDDIGGKPLTTHDYGVSAVIMRNGIEYESKRITGQIQFPFFSIPQNVVATPDVDSNKVEISWDYPFPAASGFNIYANNTKIASVDGSTRNFEYKDGLPGSPYFFSVTATDLRVQTLFESGRDSSLYTVFPLLAAPKNFTLIDSGSYNILTWTYVTTDHTSFELYRNGQLMETFAPGDRIALLDNLSGCYNEMTILATKKIGGSTYKSPLASGILNASINPTNRLSDACLNAYSNLSYSLDISGNVAAIVAPYASSRGQVWVFRKAGSKWNFEQVIDCPEPVSYAWEKQDAVVSVYGNEMAIGYRNINSGSGGAVCIFRYSSGRWSHVQTLKNTTTPEYFGFAVDLYNDRLIVGAPYYNNYQGAAYIYRKIGNTWTFLQPFNINNGQSFQGYSVAINDKYAVIGLPYWDNGTVNPDMGVAEILKFNGSAYDQSLTGLGYVYGGGSYHNFGMSCAINGDQIIIGSPNANSGKGQVHTYTGNVSTNTITARGVITSDLSISSENFGFDLDISGNRLVVGAPFKAGSYIAEGFVYSYNFNGTTWTQAQKIASPEAPKENYQYFGYNVAMDGNNMLSGTLYDDYLAPNIGSGYAFTHNGSSWVADPIYQKTPITSFTASRGDYDNQTLLEWNFTGNVSDISGFAVYRNNVLIDNPAPSKLRIFDKDGIPGKHYVYAVVPEYNDKRFCPQVTAEGWRKGNGQIKGSVVTSSSFNGVPGVKVEAIAFVDGTYWRYLDTTDAEGNFQMDYVYYGSKARYSVKVSYPGHVFEKDEQFADLDPMMNRAVVPAFRDKTAFVITGIVKRVDGCGLDSVKLNAYTYRKDGTYMGKEAYTDQNGRYSFVIDPLNPDNVRIRVAISDTQTRQGLISASSIHKFSSNSINYTSLSNMPISTELNITDNLTYPVRVEVMNTCGVIGTYKFVIDIKAKNKCYQKQFFTNDAGVLNLDLPPYEYVIRVSSATPQTAKISSVVDYLNVRPRTLNLEQLYTDSGGSKARRGLEPRQKFEFIYHKSPEILVSGPKKYLCNDPAQPIIYKQGEDETLTFNVVETHDGLTCPVTEGTLIIKNQAGVKPNAEIEYNDTFGFRDYSFTVGSPAIVSPYVKYLIAEYHTEGDGFLTETIKPVIIDGIAQQPGNDVIVKNDGDGFQWPLHILRDPPGDGSYSYIEKGTSFSRKLTMAQENTGFGGVLLETDSKWGAIGVGFDLDIKAGGGSGDEASFEVNFETNERIQTSEVSDIDNASASTYLVGNEGDIIVGTGMALKYGISERISVDAGNCKVKKSSELSVGINGPKTTWVYTLSQIKKLIDEYDSNMNLASRGQLTITGQTKDQTIAYFRNLRDNWKNVVTYHSVNTLPYYQLCDKNNYSKLKEPFKSQIGDWTKNGFCTEIGKYDKAGNFTLNDNIEWTDPLIEKYNKVSQVVRNLSDNGYQINKPGGMVFSENNLENVKLDAEYLSQWGASAENYTFAGGTSIEKTVSVEKSQSRSFKQMWSFDLESFVGMTWEAEVSFFIGGGLFAITGTEIEITDIEGRAGVQFGYSHTYEQSTENTSGERNSVGYVLADDDPGDQFNTTIFRGIDPAYTPYFTTPIGRSSCPYEPGTIPRDRPKISTKDGFNTTQYDQDPGGPVVFPVLLSNEAPAIFNETRYYQWGQTPGSNSNGATLTADGVGQYFPLLVKIPPGGSILQQFTVGIGPQSYDYPDLTMQLIPSCLNTDYIDGMNGDELNFEVYFRHPCSEVSLLTPGENWVIRKANAAVFNDQDEKLRIDLGDYDVENPLLEEIELQYRRIGTNEWKEIETFTKDFLAKFYEDNKSTYKNPQYPYIWDIKGNANLLDGEYELRARAFCGKSGYVNSNIFRGKIDRSSIFLFGSPQPSDGLLSLGDEVSVTFNKVIDCAQFDSTDYRFINLADSSELKFTHSCLNNKVIFTPVDPISVLDDIKVLARVDRAKDLSENDLIAPVIWKFTISNNPVYWRPDSLVISLYRGQKDTLPAYLFNTFPGVQNYSLNNLPQTWAKASPLSGGVPGYNNATVNIAFDAGTLAPGTYRQNLVASISGYNARILPLVLKVYPPKNNWSVNPARYSGNATVICNYTFDSTEVLSSDTMDRIAAFIDNEIRGVANIVKTGNYFRAYLNVGGNTTDNGKPIRFYVWHAKTGIEYAAKARGELNFLYNGFYGTTPQPRILDVNRVRDSVRYLPLNAGWNWVAFNNKLPRMTVENILATMKPNDGNAIKTLDRSSYFDAVTGKWIAMTNGITNVNNEDGYMVFSVKPDTLKITGNYADLGNASLKPGWNLIGNPYQTNTDINKALTGNGLSNGAIIKNDKQAGDYDSALQKWNGITSLQVNKSYMLRNGKAGVVQFRRSGNPDSISKTINPATYALNTTFLAAIWLNGAELRNENDYVIAYSGAEVRGYGKLEYVPQLDRYLLNMFVYSNKEEEVLKFKIFSKADGTSYNVPDSVVFKSDWMFGKPSRPYYFSNRQDVTSLPADPKVKQVLDLKAVPNPFGDQLELRFVSARKEAFTLSLYDRIGRLITSRTVEANAGENTVQLREASELAEGIYLLRMGNDKVNNTIKIIKR